MVELTLFKSRRINDIFPPINTLTNRILSKNPQVVSPTRNRLITKDGNVNLKRSNIPERSRYLRDLFTTLLDLPWLWILFLFVFCFVTSWIIFATIWYLIMTVNGDFDNKSLNKTNTDEHIPCVAGVKSFAGAILYSIETQQTIGYGTRAVNETCTAGIFIIIIQSIFGLMIQALWVGLVYTKLSRPRKRRRTLIWSKQLVISLRDGYLTLQCRLGDMRRRSTLVEAHIRMYFVSRRRTLENEVIPLNLLDMDVGFDAGKDRLFFNWPIIIEHRIDSRSPLYNMDREQIAKEKFEILLVLEGIIESTGMITQAKTSYMPEEIIWGARFHRMIYFDEQHYNVDYSKFHEIYYDNCTSHFSAKQLHEQKHY